MSTATKSRTAVAKAMAKEAKSTGRAKAAKPATKKPAHATSEVGAKGWYWTEAQYLKPNAKVLVDGHRYGVVSVKVSGGNVTIKFSDGGTETWPKDEPIRVNVNEWKGQAA